MLRSFAALPLLILLLCAPASVDAHKERPWPLTTPEAQGIDSALLAKAIEAARQKGAAIHSLLVVRNGRLLTEAYFYPYRSNETHDVASVTKSLTATLIGLAIADGKIKSVEQPMLDFFADRPVANIDERKRRVALKDLLTMSSGLNCLSKGGEPTLWEMLASGRDTQFMLDLPMVAEPGANFVYCSGGMHLLSAITAKATGESAESFARRRLFAPLGITRFVWPGDPQGISHGFGNLHLLPRDMAKLGQLFLQGGTWEGTPLVPADWIAAATRAQKETGTPRRYGYGWWIPAAGSAVAFEASGRGGQQISVLPDKKAVVVMTGGGFSAGDVMKSVLAAFKSDTALPANPAGQARLRAAIIAAAQPPRAQTPTQPPALAKTISGKTWALDKNWMGLEAITFHFGAQPSATFRFGAALKQFQFGRAAKVQNERAISETRRIGMDGVPIIAGGGPLGLSVAIKGAWEDDHTFALEYDELANTNCYRLRFDFHGETVSVQAKERTGLFEEKFAGRTANAPGQ